MRKKTIPQRPPREKILKLPSKPKPSTRSRVQTFTPSPSPPTSPPRTDPMVRTKTTPRYPTSAKPTPPPKAMPSKPSSSKPSSSKGKRPAAEESIPETTKSKPRMKTLPLMLMKKLIRREMLRMPRMLHEAAANCCFKAIDGPVIGKVVTSGNNKFVKGDLVLGVFTWAEYCFMKERTIMRKLEPSEFPLSYHLGVLGFSSLSAWGNDSLCGFFELCKPGEKVFVSAACGSIGSLVGQYAKLFGCYVVGCVGSQNKVTFLKDKLGFDDAFNYKEETHQSSTLRKYFSERIDIYFDNVRGKMLEAVIDNMNTFSRVVVCGATSEYIDIRKRALLDLVNVIYKRITIQEFLTPDLMIHHFQNFMIKTSNYLRPGELQVTEDILLGMESVPSAFVSLFNGSNIGKKIVRLVEEEE
ncbi:2-alkenal reductase (NADP(+)-dependent)-like [Arachis ipaensis]|uniref:2-alkenal reductase (NADP(+)-dependent)-like n=1 Tax=Arachis ipaensis TaxID=130454 RepID=UPI000A2B2764|nr:2-alkenal reductase (NADP(+)-dependent)-like [Arachis ipaensis]XP_025678334.1 2-alkenal reductase (NADP(+)-dependent)-like [Arachis hypogaea]